MTQLRFLSLASGSSGNCYYIGNGMRGILIDAGIGVRTIKKRLKEIGIDFSNVWGIFVTHDHFDHIKSVGVLGEKHNLPIYSTQTILDGINTNYGVTEKLYGSKHPIIPNEPIVLGDFTITAFNVSHDGSENLGYMVEYQGECFTLATDLGYICENTAMGINRANYLVIEANFDLDMLNEGPYPERLKRRINGATGHMNNAATAQFLAENYHNRLKHIYLCHLSNHNNTPELAYNTVATHLEKKGIKVGSDVQLVALNRTTPTGVFIFNDEAI